MQIDSGGKTYNISFAGDKTIQDVINEINGAGAGVVASINSQGTGINIRSTLSGAKFSIGENGGTTAAQLGVRSLTTSTQPDRTEPRAGHQADRQRHADFTIDRPDGIAVGDLAHRPRRSATSSI